MRGWWCTTRPRLADLLAAAAAAAGFNSCVVKLAAANGESSGPAGLDKPDY